MVIKAKKKQCSDAHHSWSNDEVITPENENENEIILNLHIGWQI